MHLAQIATFLNVLAAGLLAGGELMVYAGIRRPLAGLEPRPHIEVRQALIRKLRLLVPALLGLVIVTGLASLASATPAATPFRAAALATVAGFVLVTLRGTVPLNQAVLQWNPAHPPPGWTETIQRWERLDAIRTILALLTFALSLAGVAVGP